MSAILLFQVDMANLSGRIVITKLLKMASYPLCGPCDDMQAIICRLDVHALGEGYKHFTADA